MMAQICFEAEELQALLDDITFAEGECMRSTSDETIEKIKDGLKRLK